MKIKYSNLLVALLLPLTYVTAEEVSLTPPNAKPGECYARVMSPAKYETVAEKVIVKEATEEITIVPAVYETVEKKIEVIPASKKLILVPATYKEVLETIELKPSTRIWRMSLKKKALPVSQMILNAIKTEGVDLDNAVANTCFKEYFIPEVYKIILEDILVQNERNATEVIPTYFDAKEQSIDVLPSSKKVVQIPAEYEYVEEKVLVEEAKTVWKKGQNPSQKLSGATGEIMCLVKVPAKYKTIKKLVVMSAARTEIQEVPAEVQKVAVQTIVAEPTLKNILIPAVYETVEKKVFESKASFKWVNTNVGVDAPWQSTGNQICLIEETVATQDVTTVVLDAAESVTEEVIPATFEVIEVQKLVSAEKEVRTPIEAEYKMVEKRKKLANTHVGWKRILCQTNMTNDVITQIQFSLNKKGYSVGEADGLLGRGTSRALERFQKDSNLATGGVTYETLGALNIEL